MRNLRRAWRSFLARPWADRARLVRRLVDEAREHGMHSVMGRIRQGAALASAHDGYPAWCAAHTPTSADLDRMRAEAACFGYRPLISIITPAYNTDPRWLEACADAVVAQAYPFWQWCIGNDGSTHPGTVAALERIAARDARIVVSRAPVNGGISSASNLALSQAKGEYVALLDSDDAMLPHALFRVVEHLNRPGERADVIYSDEDKLDLDGNRCEPYFKPDWSPDLFLSNMYVCHLLVARRSLVHDVGAFRSAFDYSQDYDLMLRLSEHARRIDHISDILYHWRKVPQSGAMAGDAKPAAHIAGRLALQDHLDRRAVPGQVIDVGPPGFYRVHYHLTRQPLVSVVVGAGARAGMARHVEERTAYARFEFATAPEGVAGDYLLFVDQEMTPAEASWLEALLEIAEQPGVGVVGPRLIGQDGTLRDIGLVVGAHGFAARPLAGLPAQHGGYFGNAIVIRNVAAIGGACLLTPRLLWQALGGFDMALSSDARALDYCLKARQAGHRVVVTPASSMIVPRPPSAEVRIRRNEQVRLRGRWGAALESDPYYNPNLSRFDLYQRLRK